MSDKKSTRQGSQTLSVSVKKDLKEQFEDLYINSDSNSKGEFFGLLIENYLKPDKEKIVEVPVEKVVEKPIEVTVENIKEIEKPLAENEILVRLNPVQLYALGIPFALNGFIDRANEQAGELLQKRAYWTGEVKYPDFYTTYEKGKKNVRENMGRLLVNIFMSSISNGLLNDIIDIKEIQAKARELKEKQEMPERIDIDDEHGETEEEPAPAQNDQPEDEIDNKVTALESRIEELESYIKVLKEIGVA